MHLIRPATLVFVSAALAACGSFGTGKEIEGNNTGGFIPAALAKGNNPQALADAHCARWKSTARITANAVDTGGDVVFICEVGGQPAMTVPPAPPQTPSATTKR
jgi:hypothetical protein